MKAEKVWKIQKRVFPDLIDQILFNRGIIQKENKDIKKEAFLSPNFSRDLYDPFLMSGMKEAVAIISDAYKTKKKSIGIFADYDADGIPGAALLHKTLTKIGFKPITYIPNRESGYGLSPEGIDYLHDKGCDLIITVDLGIRSLDEAKYCREKNIKLIITDHHLPGDKLPSADVIINPKIIGDKYPFKELCGCGVAYKLATALSSEFPIIDEKFLKWNLDLVAISTIADVVPVVEENRVIAQYGLLVLKKTKNIGIKELIRKAGVVFQNISSYQVGFQIAPRINAPGRMDHATKSFELLVTEDASEVEILSASLEDSNENRQNEMNRAEKEACEIIENEKLYQNKIIVVSGDWQKGVIGPTASRIVEKYYRPVILFSNKDKSLTGSARSINNINIVDIITKVSDLVDRFGGHKGAAGLTVSDENFSEFRRKIIEISDEEITDNSLRKEIKIDAEITMEDISMNLYENILKMEPFGLGNPRPVFLLKNIKIREHRFVGKNESHLSFFTVNSSNRLKSIYFNSSILKKDLEDNKEYDIVFNIDVNEWNGETNLNLNIVDIKNSKI